MINLKLSEGFVYDLLAIAEVKYQKNPSNSAAASNLRKLNSEIVEQVGIKTHTEINASKEYEEMLTVNELIYDKLDNMKRFGERNGDALEVDGLVYRRFLAKQALQNKFFPNNDLGEQKFGYVKEKS